MLRLIENIFRFIASYGLACVLLVLLLLVTFLGTLEQVDHGIYDVKGRYFESFLVVHLLLDRIPVALPGAYLLLVLLSINLLCGGVVRMQKTARRIGILIVHVGIVMLLAAGLLKHQLAVDGHLTLYEGDGSSEFESYYDWEVAVWRADASPITEYLIPWDEVLETPHGRSVTFTSPALPFDFTVEEYERNCIPQPASPFTAEAGERAVDGHFLHGLRKSKEAEENVPGARVRLRERDSGQEHEGILWGASRWPLAIGLSDAVWAVDLRRRRYTLPFEIVLDTFTREFHPGTTVPKSFMSEVTCIEDGAEQRVKISMNKPLRRRDYTFYQASWGPQEAPPGTRLFSTFAVVCDPVEKGPLYASVVITLGLVVHFSMMLGSHLRRESRRTA